MKRPILIHCTALKDKHQISLLASLSSIRLKLSKAQIAVEEDLRPIENLGLLRSRKFYICIHLLGQEGKSLNILKYETDSMGQLEARLPAQVGKKKVHSLILYETSFVEGIDLFLGAIIPTKLQEYNKIVISDFDKTLLETQFQTLPDLYQSLRSPMQSWPTLPRGLELFKNYIGHDFLPFVLSASPHFYMRPIRDWLYQQEIYQAHIFLKDYRHFLWNGTGALTTKDIKKQGFYKLRQLITIISLTGIPDEIALMGDAIEHDVDIYMILTAFLLRKQSPWELWNQIKSQKIFHFTTKQDFDFLNRLYILDQKLAKKRPQISISIRGPHRDLTSLKNKTAILNSVKDEYKKINFYYDGPQNELK